MPTFRNPFPGSLTRLSSYFIKINFCVLCVNLFFCFFFYDYSAPFTTNFTICFSLVYKKSHNPTKLKIESLPTKRRP